MSPESLFDALTREKQLLIEEAFDTIVRLDSTISTVHGLGSTGEDTGGGFIVENNETSGGGFIEEDENEELTAQHIPMHLIPSALQQLDLPPDDEEILAVFRNAASGWTSGSINSFPNIDANEKYVSREDWRSVCAVLLENHDYDDQETRYEQSTHSANEHDSMSDVHDQEERSSDDYIGDSDDEYGKEKKTLASRRRRASRKEGRSTMPSTKEPTKRQRETCLNAFALFFPDVSLDALPKQILKVTDLQSVFKLLGESIKADEMLEMLEMFSSSPNKTMNFDDFIRMMITVQLA